MPRSKLPPKDFEWSGELAYAIGLLATDGNLSGDGQHITLRSSDKDQLETFKKCLHLSNKIAAPPASGQYAVRTCYRIQFGGAQFYRWLLKIGLFPNKTYTIGPIDVPDKFFRDFLRGHLDGDGSITTYQDRYNTFKNSEYVYTRLFVRFISASKRHTEWIRNTIIRLLGIKGDVHEAPPAQGRKGVSIWQLKFMKKESIKLLNWLYYSKDIPALARKREKAERALAVISSIKRKPYTRKFDTL